jgi:hypothetical protein
MKRKRFLQLIGISIIACLVMPLSLFKRSEARIFYLSSHGSNQNDGSIENPFKTLQYAITQAKRSNTIIIKSGIYKL